MAEKVLVPDLNRLERERLRSLGFSLSSSCAESSADDRGDVTIPGKQEHISLVVVCNRN